MRRRKNREQKKNIEGEEDMVYVICYKSQCNVVQKFIDICVFSYSWTLINRKGENSLNSRQFRTKLIEKEQARFSQNDHKDKTENSRSIFTQVDAT